MSRDVARIFPAGGEGLKPTRSPRPKDLRHEGTKARIGFFGG